MGVAQLEIGLEWRTVYFVAGWGLVFLRCGGLVTSFMSGLAGFTKENVD